jgi:hypothetical protein
MKNKILQLFLILPVLFIGSLSANSQTKNTFIGSWNFEAPTAPESYTSGIMKIQKDSVITTFTGRKYKFTSIWVKIKMDSLTYKVNIDGDDVLFSLKVDNKNKITGNAVWSSGETLINAAQNIIQKPEAPKL